MKKKAYQYNNFCSDSDWSLCLQKWEQDFKWTDWLILLEAQVQANIAYLQGTQAKHIYSRWLNRGEERSGSSCQAQRASPYMAWDNSKHNEKVSERRGYSYLLL